MAELKLPAVPKPIAAPKLDIPKNTAPDATVRNLTSMTPSNVTKGPMDIIGEMKAGQEKTFKDITTARDVQYKSAEAEQSAKAVVDEDVRKSRKEESLKQDKQLDEFMSGQRSKELPYPDFQPTQETGVSIAELGGMLATLGVMLGTGAKGNAIAAVGALRGAMDGWNKGRKDLWQKEMKTFETEVNKMKTHNEQLNKYTQQYLQLYPTRRLEAMQNAEAAIRIAGSNSIFAHTLKTKKAEDVITDLNNLNLATQKTFVQILKVQNDLQRQKDTQNQRDIANNLAERRIAAAEKNANKNLPKDKEKNEHRFRFTALANITDVLNDLKKPEIRKLIGPTNKFTPNILLNLQKNYPELAQKLARFQSEEFKLGGKNLTVSEQKILDPIYGWMGLTANALESNLTEAKRYLSREQGILEEEYPGLAKLTPIYKKYVSEIQPDQPSAPQKSTNQADFDAKWKDLKPNQTLVGPDGKTYRK